MVRQGHHLKVTKVTKEDKVHRVELEIRLKDHKVVRVMLILDQKDLKGILTLGKKVLKVIRIRDHKDQ